jgi:hypothetical protein
VNTDAPQKGSQEVMERGMLSAISSRKKITTEQIKG